MAATQMKLQTRKCPDCGQQQVRLTSRTDFKSPIQWGCGSCGRIDTAEAPLTRREEEVVRLICQGKSGKEIAIALGIAENGRDAPRQYPFKIESSRHRAAGDLGNPQSDR